MLDVFMAILFIFACCVEISKINAGYVNTHYSLKCQISRGEELSRWLGLLNWLLPQSRGPEKGQRASCFYSLYFDMQYLLFGSFTRKRLQADP